MAWLLRVKDRFSSAHFLKNYHGKCEKIHGHTFEIEVFIEVNELNQAGIGIDFTEIKDKLSEILPDHKLLNEIYDFNPSAENLSKYFYQELKKIYPVKKVVVWESENASAEYSEDF